METLVKDLESQSRTTPISWEDLIENILDSYRQYIDDLSHAVQKDAIQNSVDARDPSSNILEVAFKLTRSGEHVFIVEDHGTTGLTGRILALDEYEKDLPEEERWGRFEGLAFRRTNPKALGARGQGKFVFVGMSKRKTIVYDTLRNDGVYRLGARRLGSVLVFENEKAREKLKEYCPSLGPLTRVGTRIIILEPDETLRKAVRSGAFKRYIQTTWWPALHDPNVNISLEIDGRSERISSPKDLKFPSKDTDDIKVWIQEWDPIGIYGKKFNIRKLHLCWMKQPLAQDVRGIAILRGGMVVERVSVSELMAGLPSEISEHTYGYIEGDDGVQYLLKKVEDPTHYRFKRRGMMAYGRQNILARVLTYASKEFRQFIQKKLGFKEHEKTRNFTQLLHRFSRIMKKLGIFLGKEKGPPPPPVEPKPIDLVFSQPEFPHELPRVDFGERIKNFGVKIKNKTGHQAKARLRINSVQGDIIRDVLVNEEIDISPSESREIGPFELEVTKKYSKGVCKVRGFLNCLSHPEFERGTDLDKSSFAFWIEEDPPPSGNPFKDIVAIKDKIIEKIGSREVNLDYKVEPHPGGGYILKYTTAHPAYLEKCRTDEEENRYVLEIMARAISDLLINQDDKWFRDVDDPSDIVRRSSALCSEILAAFYGGK